MHDWRFVSERRRPLNSYGSDREATWKCSNCLETTTTDDKDERPYAGSDDRCDMTAVKAVMES